MKKMIGNSLALLALALLPGCAGMALNNIDLTLSRNITVGQELMDLKAAHEKGVISDTEYAKAKQSVLNMVDTMGKLHDD